MECDSHTLTTFQVVAEDRDLGENADITYRFDTPSDYFELNADSGEIKTRQLLEPAAVTLHRLNVVATDGGQPPLSATGASRRKHAITRGKPRCVRFRLGLGFFKKVEISTGSVTIIWNLHSRDLTSS